MDSGYILIADRNAKRLKMMESILLSSGYNVEKLSDGKSLLDEAISRKPDLVITDISIPQLNGLYIKAKLNDNSGMSNIPVLILTDNFLLMQRFRAFAIRDEEYLVRPFTKKELLNRIRSLLHRKNYYSNNAVIDNNTGIFNSMFFMEQLSLFFNAAEKYDEKYSIALIDVNKLNCINNKYGYGCGELILRKFIEIAKESSRNTDMITRYGGDEFGILFPGADNKTATEIINRIKLNTAKRNFLFPEINASISFSVSSGIATYDKSMKSVNAIFEKADENLYLEKSKGNS